MKFLPLAEILISSDRQRQEFDPSKIQDLGNSISSIGLLHPIIVRSSTEGVVLVAGERRVKAIKNIVGLGGTYTFEGKQVADEAIPCIELGELTDLDAAEAEYDENDKRDNLAWQEKAAATVRLAKLRGSQAALKGLPPPTVNELATEIHGSGKAYPHDITRKELIVARHFNDPEVAGAASLDEAFKTLKKREEVQRRVELAERVGQTFTAHAHSLHNRDAVAWLKECPAAVFDVILTDPPYGTNADAYGPAGGGLGAGHEYGDSPELLRALLQVLPAELFRVTKSEAHLYWFCDIDWYAEIRDRFTDAGWRVHRTPLIWHKPNGYAAPWPEQGPRRNYELILYAVKGQRPCNILLGDVLTFPTEKGAEPAQKPVVLIHDLLRRSAKPGDSVLDPCCGTGPIFPVAHQLKVTAVGIEISAARYTKALDRLTILKETA